MDTHHDSEQKLLLKIQDKMRQMRLRRKKPLAELRASRKLRVPIPARPEFPCRRLRQGFKKRAHTFVISVMNDIGQMFAKRLRRKAAGAGLWVFRLQQCTKECDLKIIWLWGVPAELN